MFKIVRIVIFIYAQFYKHKGIDQTKFLGHLIYIKRAYKYIYIYI